MTKKRFWVVFSLLAVLATGVLAWSTYMALRSSPSAPANLEACRAAMRQQLAASMANGTKGTRPPACDGASDQQLAQIADELIEELMTGE